jgi:uncharacterized protein with HEPN domain
MKHDEVFLQHIRDEIDFLLEKTRGLTFETFVRDEVLKRACARSLEIIGEATKNLSINLKGEFKDIEWKKIAGLRDKVIHEYFGVDWDIVWDVLQNRLAHLKSQILEVLKKFS